MVRGYRLPALLFAVMWGASATWAKSPSLDEAHAALQAAQQNAVAHRTATVRARAKARADAAAAALLAEQQVAAAAALRRLEAQTANDASGLAALQGQSAAAAQTLRDNEAALAKLLPIMQRLSGQPAATMLAVPASPDNAVRGIIVMQGIAAEIEARAEAVKRQSQQLAALTAQSRTQQAALTAAVATQQQAEDALNAQITAAKAAEMADAETVLSEGAAAVAANRKIGDLRDVIDRLQAAAVPAPASQIRVGPGLGGAPVAGVIFQKFGDGTVAGPAEGVSYRTAPGARVVTPCAGPVLFADNFQTYGKVVIMDCGGGYAFVLSGMEHLDVSVGQKLSHGQPVGEMLRYDPYEPTRQPVLYVELRRNGAPMDPAAWLNGRSG